MVLRNSHRKVFPVAKSRTGVQRNLSKSSLSTDEGSTIPTVIPSSKVLDKPLRRVQFLVEEESNTQQHEQHQHYQHEQHQHQHKQYQHQVILIPTLSELPIHDLYYSREEIRDMQTRAKHTARNATSLVRILSTLNVNATTQRQYKKLRLLLDNQNSDNNKNNNNKNNNNGCCCLWQGYQVLLQLYQDEEEHYTASTAYTAFRGLEHYLLGDAHADYRKWAIQRILEVQGEDGAALMRMRSLLQSRKACSVAERVALTDALEAAAA